MRRRVLVVALVLASSSTATATAGPKSTRVSLEAVVAVGGLTAKRVTRAVAAAKQPLRECHRARAADSPGLGGGAIAATFTIEPDGTVAPGMASGIDGTLASCVTTALAGLAFPTATTATTVTLRVRYQAAIDKTLARIADLTRSRVQLDRGAWADFDLERMLHDRSHPPSLAPVGASSGGRMRGDGDVRIGSGRGLQEVGGPADHVDQIVEPVPASMAAAAGVVLAHRDSLIACAGPASDERALQLVVSIAAAGGVTATTVGGRATADVTACAIAAASTMRFPADTGDTALAIELTGDAAPRIGPHVHAPR